MIYSFSEIPPFSNNLFFDAPADEINDIINSAIAQVCSLEYETELTKNSLPLTVCDAVCGNLMGENPSPAQGIREFVFRLTSRGSSNDSRIFSKVKNLLSCAGEPLFWKTASENQSAVIIDIVPENSWQMHHQFFGGVRVPYIIWDLIVHIGKES